MASKKEKKALIWPAMTGTFRSSPKGSPSRRAALPSYTKARRDNRCPLPPLPVMDAACPCRHPFRAGAALAPGRSRGMEVPSSDARPEASMQPLRFPHTEGEEQARRRPRGKKRPCRTLPAPDAWPQPAASGCGRQERRNRSGAGACPGPVSALLLTDGPQ